ncbi:MAG: helix-turn-helix transcriptional regulator [Clostridiales bacterium]|nr:helix-turn-helix transcriptional regulator [Clostridiales bacterium]
MGMGAKLKSIIDEQGIKVSDIAENIGVNPTTLYSFLNRDSDGIKLSVFFKMCDYLKISPESLKQTEEIKNTSYIPTDYLLGPEEAKKQASNNVAQSNDKLKALFTKIMSDDPNSFRRRLVIAILKLDDNEIDKIEQFMRNLINRDNIDE